MSALWGFLASTFGAADPEENIDESLLPPKEGRRKPNQSDWYGINIENLIELGIETDFTPQRFIEDREITKTLSSVPAQIEKDKSLRVIYIPKEKLSSLLLSGTFVDSLLSK
jgi:hypothetical protein